MPASHARLSRLVITLLLLGCASRTFAQAPVPPTPLSRIDSQTFTAVWKRVADAPDAAKALQSASTPEARKAEYGKLLRAFLAQDEFKDARQGALSEIVGELNEQAPATATNAALTNPAANQLIERSGLTNLVSLAADLRKVVSANNAAVSVSLNAIALLGGTASDDTHSAPYRYARHEEWRRLGGTITFGAQVPEKEITGISGLPDSETLFDALSWDIKLRLVGDRDTRASRWNQLLIGVLGHQVEFLTRAQGLPVPPADAGLLRDAANDLLGKELKAATDEIQHSLQMSVKAAGVHLTKVDGKNKYSFGMMLDKGFAGLDFTLNAAYSVADSSNAVTGTYSAKDLQLAAGLTGSVWKGLLEADRAVELTASLKGQVVNDGANPTADRRNTFSVNATATLPFQLKGKIPLSVTWTNDPANLTKQKYVRAQVGLNYDFSAIWGVLKK